MAVPGAGDTIHRMVMTWPGVTAHAHRFGGTEYRLGRRELGHVHGDFQIDVPFPRRVRDQLVEAGLASAHHILPQSGWISFYLREAGDVNRAIDLLRQSLTLAQKKWSHR